MRVNEWYNPVQTQVALAKYPQELPRFYREILWFFLKDESFVSKTLNEGHVELSKFPASTVCQLAKKMKNFQATAQHIKTCHKRPTSGTSQSPVTSAHRDTHPLSPRRKIKPSSLGKKPTSFMMRNQENHKKRENLILSTQGKTDAVRVVIPHM